MALEQGRAARGIGVSYTPGDPVICEQMGAGYWAVRHVFRLFRQRSKDDASIVPRLVVAILSENEVPRGQFERSNHAGMHHSN